MNVFLVKITNLNNVNKINSNKLFVHEDIYNFESEINVDAYVFFVYGGDKSQISWEQGLIGFGKVVKAPYDKGYSSTNPRYFKIDVQPILVLDRAIPFRETKLDKMFQDDLYDVPYVGANHFPNQAIARAQDAGAVALFSILYKNSSAEQQALIPQELISPLLRKSLPIYHRKKNISKPFLLLAGISGTGKSRFVREQAKQSGGEEEPSNYALISVRPDWHEPSDLLGYVSRLGEDAPHFVSTLTLKFMVQAWKAIDPSPEELTANRFFDKNVLPYWLCLDEMNLAPVEQYFADYLSVIETREWTEQGYRCAPLLKADVIAGLSDKGKAALKKDLGLDTDFDPLWDYFTEKGIPLPYNLIVAGTVNMDETTHGFSRKVIDRALSIDFGEFFPNEFGSFFKDEQSITPILLGYPTASEAREKTQAAEQSRRFLSALNERALKGTAFEVAFRALNELLLSVHSFSPYDDSLGKLQAVWDDFLMMKVLPRIEGDRDKVEQVLEKLSIILTEQLNDIWSDEAKRPDLWRDTEEMIACRSKAKIKWMQERLNQSGFTSFWP